MFHCNLGRKAVKILDQIQCDWAISYSDLTHFRFRLNIALSYIETYHEWYIDIVILCSLYRSVLAIDGAYATDDIQWKQHIICQRHNSLIMLNTRPVYWLIHFLTTQLI